MKTLLLPFVILVVFCSSCASERSRAPSYGWTSPNNTTKNQPGKPEQSDRVVIYNAFLTLVVHDADSTNSRLARIANKYGGYVLRIGSEESVIRVKVASLNNAIQDICNGGGKLKRKQIAGEDITEDYEDSKIRLENSYKARQRYLELLAKAENVEAALKVEHELERLNKEIDVLEGRIKRMQHLTEYSTITVHLEKKIKPGILGYIGLGLYHSIKWLFVRN